MLVGDAIGGPNQEGNNRIYDIPGIAREFHQFGSFFGRDPRRVWMPGVWFGRPGSQRGIGYGKRLGPVHEQDGNTLDDGVMVTVGTI